MNTVAGSLRFARGLAVIVFLYILYGLAQAVDTHAGKYFSPVAPLKAQYNIDCTIEFDSIEANGSGLWLCLQSRFQDA